VLAEKLFRAQRHPLRFGVTVQVVFAEVRTIVRGAVFTRDHYQIAAEAFFAKRLRRGVAGRTRTDDDELSGICKWIVSNHRRRTPVRNVVRHSHQDLFTIYADAVRDECVECRRVFKIAVDDVEGCVVPRTDDTSAAEHTFGEWAAVVRTGSADCVEFVVNARQQNACLSNRDFFHFAVAEVGCIRDVNFFRPHDPC